MGVGGDGARGAVQAVDVIDLRQGQQDRGVGLQRGLEEVPVQFAGAVEEALEDVPAQADDAAQADRRPQRIASADPVPEGEGASAAKGGGALRRGGDADEVLVHAVGGQGRRQPGLGDLCVGQGFLGGEGLGDDDDQGGFRLQPRQGLSHVTRVDIGDEAHVDGRIERAQGVPDHARPQIRSADPDMDHGLERPSGRACLDAGPDGVGVVAHLAAHSVHLGGHGLAQGVEVGTGGGAQGGVQHRPAFGGVDGLAVEQGGAAALHVGGAGQGQSGVEAGAGPALLGQVQMQTGGVHRQTRQAIRVGGELIADASVGVPAGDGFQFGPGGVRHRRLPRSASGQVRHGACNPSFMAQA
ncbi:hypothetical protein D3C80_701850 [compost metagenome]